MEQDEKQKSSRKESPNIVVFSRQPSAPQQPASAQPSKQEKVKGQILSSSAESIKKLQKIQKWAKKIQTAAQELVTLVEPDN